MKIVCDCGAVALDTAHLVRVLHEAKGVLPIPNNRYDFECVVRPGQETPVVDICCLRCWKKLILVVAAGQARAVQ